MKLYEIVYITSEGKKAVGYAEGNTFMDVENKVMTEITNLDYIINIKLLASGGQYGKPTFLIKND